MSIEGQGDFFTIYFPGFVFLCFTRPSYRVSVYRTIRPLVSLITPVLFVFYFQYTQSKLIFVSIWGGIILAVSLNFSVIVCMKTYTYVGFIQI